MIYIATSLFFEAVPFINFFQLKKDISENKFQVFKSDKVTLIIGGVGPIKASAAAAYILCKFSADKEDFFLNIGICGAYSSCVEKGSALICSKIINADSRRCFYPDLIYKHPFKEAVLYTSSSIVTDIPDVEADIADMEGAAAFEAASIFLPPHRIGIIKIVSDHLKDSKKISRVEVTQLIEKNIELISKWLEQIYGYNSEYIEILDKEDSEVINYIIHNFKFTETMNYEFIKLCEKYKIRHGNVKNVLMNYETITTDIKAEGKRYFADIRKKLFE